MCGKEFVCTNCVTFGLTKALDEDETSNWLYCAPGCSSEKAMKYLAAEIEIMLVFKNTKQGLWTI